jgi:REP element-mobilizing transposase RayT
MKKTYFLRIPYIGKEYRERMGAPRLPLASTPLKEGNYNTPPVFGRYSSIRGEFLLTYFPLLTYSFIIDESVIMPNHIHGIIILNENISIIGANVVGAKNFSPLHNNRLCGTSRTIGSIVRGFKIGCTKWFRKHTDIYTVWQRNYYEHIIRNEIELNKIRGYILNNPLNWEIDENYRI